MIDHQQPDFFAVAGDHDPGGKTRLAMPAGVTGDAVFSACGRYRQVLTRRWGPADAYALWIGMNPSVAGAEVDDRTVAWECDYTRTRLGLDAYAKVNVMDYRATYPSDLLTLEVSACSIANSGEITRLARQAHIVIAAWGCIHPKLRHHAEYVHQFLKQDGIDLWCVGFAKDGSPRHPLYVRKDSPLVRFPRGVAHG